MPKPHLVIFNPDQWRGDVLGHVGNPAAVTPNLDQLVATDAVSFRNAFCQNPVCTPSRCSFMSGWYPHVRGHRTMHHMMRPDEPVLLRTLKENGYFVWWGGKNDLVPAQSGFDAYCHVKHRPDPDGLRPMFAMDRQAEWRGEPGADTYYSFQVGRLPAEDGGHYPDSDWAHVNAAIEQIHRWADQDHDEAEALCLYLPLTYPHPPYGVEEPWFSMIDPELLPDRPTGPDPASAGEPAMLAGIRARQGLTGWAEDRWRELRATYYGMCARVDHQLGLVLQALRDAGLYDDTALFFFSDHGDFTGDYGLVEKTQNTFADCLTRVPLIIKPPASVPTEAGVRDALAELIDVPATIEALTGITPGHTHFGRSLLPVVTGGVDDHRDAVFCEGGRLRGERQAMERESRASDDPTGLYWPRLSLQAGDGPEHGKAAMCRTADHKYVHRLYETDELYDLRADPAETRNMINDPGYADVARTLSLRLLAWYQETADAVPHQADQR
ncbi:sulfatase-like hydrolase/transferase [Microlunatus sp. GCM10028923]|uniref:sulfatase-like hydrolase/transferase n=1 Tax=Microlunatus sp. GCM10028923 TaxID=3273400 RepID=UPI003612FA58